MKLFIFFAMMTLAVVSQDDIEVFLSVEAQTSTANAATGGADSLTLQLELSFAAMPTAQQISDAQAQAQTDLENVQAAVKQGTVAIVALIAQKVAAAKSNANDLANALSAAAMAAQTRIQNLPAELAEIAANRNATADATKDIITRVTSAKTGIVNSCTAAAANAALAGLAIARDLLQNTRDSIAAVRTFVSDVYSDIQNAPGTTTDQVLQWLNVSSPTANATLISEYNAIYTALATQYQTAVRVSNVENVTSALAARCQDLEKSLSNAVSNIQNDLKNNAASTKDEIVAKWNTADCMSFEQLVVGTHPFVNVTNIPIGPVVKEIKGIIADSVDQVTALVQAVVGVCEIAQDETTIQVTITVKRSNSYDATVSANPSSGSNGFVVIPSLFVLASALLLAVF